MERASLTTHELKEENYAADFRLLESYLGFSSELLRLALAGLAAIGFLISLAIEKASRRFAGFLDEPTASNALIVSAVALGVAAALAVAHKYSAPDGMFHHLRALRIYASGDQERAQHADQIRNGRFRMSGWWLTGSAVSLVLGAAALITSFVAVLSQQVPPVDQ
jgi:hypothetical protein